MGLEHFSENLKYIRSLTGLTQEEFADKLYISYDYYIKLENGNTPSLAVAYRICEVTDISSDLLFKGDRSRSVHANLAMLEEMRNMSDEQFEFFSKTLELQYKYFKNRIGESENE